MTREELIEVMARAQCSDGGFDPDERMPNDGPRWGYYVPGVTAALAALEAAGVRLVPVEATHKMADVGTEARWQSAVRDANNVREIWRAMLAASPYAPQKDETK